MAAVMERWFLAAVVVFAGCRRAGPEVTPEGVVQAFLAASEGYGRDPAAPERVYKLLCKETREPLREAAERATALGLPAKPEQMLARWSAPAFAPERFVFDGRAAVDVYGADPRTQHARFVVAQEGAVYCVRL